MALTYDIFHREKINRLPSMLVKPRLLPVLDFELPRESLLHYTGEGPDDPGPPANYRLFINIKRSIPIYHVLEMQGRRGNPTRIGINVEAAAIAYQVKNRKYRRVTLFQNGLKDKTVPFVMNYSYLDRKWRYLGKRDIIPFNRNSNMWETIIHNMLELSNISDRNQFIFVQAPQILPSISILRRASKEKELPPAIAKDLGGFDKVFLYNLFLWLGKNREKSLFNVIPLEKINKINFIIKDSDAYSILNLGDLNDMRKVNGSSGIDPALLQLRLLQFYINLANVRNNSIEDIEQSYQELEQNIKPDNNDSKKATNEIDENSNEVTEMMVSEDNDRNTVNKDTNEIINENNYSDLTDDKLYIEDKNTDTFTVTDLSEEEENTRLIRILEDQINDQLSYLTKVEERSSVVEGDDVKASELNTDYDVYPPEKGVQDKLNELSDQGAISANDYKKYSEEAKKYKQLKYPNSNITLEEFTVIPNEDKEVKEISIPDIPTVTDKEMLQSTLLDWDSKYINKVMNKDTLRMVLAVQNAGICLTDYKVTRDEDANGAFDSFTIKLNPVQGLPSTIKFKLPAVNSDGVFESNGIKYRLRKQKRDLPIRKISDTRVALTSYYGKIFIDKSVRRANNYSRWLANNIRESAFDPNNKVILQTRTLDVFEHHAKVPYVYSILAKNFKSVKTNKYYLFFDYNERYKKFGEEKVKEIEKGDFVIIGMNYITKDYIVVSNDNCFHQVIKKKDQSNPLYKSLGSIENLLEFNLKNAPIESIEITVLSVSIPLGIVLGYEMGLENLIKRLDITYRRIPTGKHLNMEDNEYCIRFDDETFIFNRNDRLASLLLSGFITYQKNIINYSVMSFNKKDVYFNILDSNGIGSRYINELDSMFQLFIDPITLDLLKQMKEPTQFRGLLFRSAELLLTADHPDEVDASQMRICSYERIPGTVYTELVKAIKRHNNRGLKSSYPIDINPNAIWMTLANDPAKRILEELNPIQNLKQFEAVTFSGNGGRSRETMVQGTRAYDKHDLGIVSEATVDSGDVGINVFLSADPNITSVYGLGKPIEIKPGEKPNVTKLFSTSSNLSVGVEKDDSKRRGFVNIMHDHTVPCKNYKISPVRTGYELVIPHRTSDLFSATADDDGVVENIKNNVLTVKLKNGNFQKIQLGRRFGSSGGLTVPHLVKTDLSIGSKVTKGQVICYNPAFFGPDPLDKNQIAWKAGALARTILVEDAMTLEDSSAISENISEALTTYMTKEKNIIVSFNQEIHNLVTIGQEVKVDDILCLIEDSITSSSKLFDEDNIQSLKNLSNMAPKSDTIGRVEKIEVYYNGDKEDMSDSLKEISDASDRRMVTMKKALGKKQFGGLVTADYRVDGNPLDYDQAVIKIFITGMVKAHSGDKGVLGNQMKTTFAKVFSKDTQPYTEDGKPIDVIFGAKSVAARIVESMYITGTTNSLLKTIGEKAAEIYFNQK